MVLRITSLKPNEIILVGTNTKGRHGALTARKKFGLKLGHSEGLCGQSYCIVTKDLSKGLRSIPLKDIESQIKEFNTFTKENDFTFYITKIGYGLGGYRDSKILPLFQKFDWPDNVVFPEDWQ